MEEKKARVATLNIDDVIDKVKALPYDDLITWTTRLVGFHWDIIGGCTRSMENFQSDMKKIGEFEGEKREQMLSGLFSVQYAVCEFMDSSCGYLKAALEDIGMDEKTLLALTELREVAQIRKDNIKIIRDTVNDD